MLKGINGSMPDLEKALKDYAIDEYYEKAFDLVLSGKAREAFDLSKETDKVRDRYGRTTFGQGLLLSRRLIEAGTRFVQMNWPAVANGNPEVDAWDTHAANFGPLKNLHCPVLDRGLSALLEDMAARHVKDTLLVTIGEFGRSPRLGVSTSGNTNSPMAAITGRTVIPVWWLEPAYPWAAFTALRTRRHRRRKKSRCTRTTCWRRFTTRSASIPT